MRKINIMDPVRRMAASIAVLTLLVVAGTIFGPSSKASASDCGPNAIIYCGFSSNDQFINYLSANKDSYPGSPHRDLQDIMSFYNLDPSEYERFRTTARSGTVYNDGRIVVDGQTVANDASSVGRTTLSGRHDQSVDIGAGTYYYGNVSKVFRSASIPAKVMFDAQGNAEFTVLTDCGNPVFGINVKSSVGCDLLSKSLVSGTTDTYNFTTNTSLNGNAKITKCDYDFGDGSAVYSSAGCGAAKHTFKSGTWTTKVTVYASVPGGNTITAVSTNCQQTVNVVPHVKIEKYVNDKNKKSDTVIAGKNYIYTLRVTNDGSAPLNNVIVSDTAPNNITFVSTDQGKITNNKLNYSISKLAVKQVVTIKITAKVNVYTADTIKNTACVKSDEVKRDDICDNADVKVKKPNVKIEKYVNDKKSDDVAVGQNYIYKLKITNNGETPLTNVVVTDTAPNNVKFVSADIGSVSDNKYTYTIPNFAVNQTLTIKITAKVTTYVADAIKNTACVKSDEMNRNDICDNASVKVKTVPYYQCVELSGPKPDGFKYSFVAKVNYGNGAKLKAADFTFGDGTSATGVTPSTSDATSIGVQHSYVKAAEYNVSAVIHFTLDGKDVTAPTCSAIVKPATPPAPECKPGVPVGDVRCNPCPYDASITADNESCKAPVQPVTTLPNTGAGNVVAVGAAALVGGFLFYRQRVFKRHRAEAYQAEIGSSILPLANPLDPDDPLAVTPLEPQRMHHSPFRRRRQF